MYVVLYLNLLIEFDKNHIVNHNSKISELQPPANILARSHLISHRPTTKAAFFVLIFYTFIWI